ncbi:MAG: winged helix-turn-helix transcriptional regulator [Candidatus Bathyarchaeia archaeon]
MIKRGIGADQIKKSELSTQKILAVLKDGAWHRYMEILKETKISPTTLTKRLKELEKGIVERKLDTEGKEYPPPVAYRIRNSELASSIEKEIEQAKKVASLISKNRNVTYSAIAYFLKTAQLNFNIHLLLNLQLFFWKAKNEGDPRTEEETKASRENAYTQYLESLIMPNFTNWLSILKEKLEDLEKQGVNVTTLLRDANIQVMKDGLPEFGIIVKFPEKDVCTHDASVSAKFSEELQKRKEIDAKIFAVMCDGKPHTDEEISEKTKLPATEISSYFSRSKKEAEKVS